MDVRACVHACMWAGVWMHVNGGSCMRACVHVRRHLAGMPGGTPAARGGHMPHDAAGLHAA
eukprot:113945-Chlamydomonas_euryale.AAC.3